MAHTDGDDEDGGFRVEFDPLGDSISQQVVEAVATFREIESTDLDPLYSVIDPDALNDLFAPTRGDRSLKGEVTFLYEGLAVSVNGAGTIRLCDPE